MAVGVATLMDADIAVAVTGAAGPDPHDGAVPGTVIIAVFDSANVTSREYRLDGAPDDVCRQACDLALGDLERALLHTREGVP
jgi:nicotinamide-nucleotide amidase